MWLKFYSLIDSFVHSLNIYKLLTLCKAMVLPKLIQKSIWIYCLFHIDLFYLFPKGKDEAWGKRMMCLFLLWRSVSQLSQLFTIRQGLQGLLAEHFFESFGRQHLVLQASHYFMNLKSKTETIQKLYLDLFTSIHMHTQWSSGIISLKNILRVKNRLSLLRAQQLNLRDSVSNLPKKIMYWE